MKLNKMTLIAALALGSLLTLSTGVNAQDATTNAPAAATPPRRPGPMTIETLTTQLALSDEQKTNVQVILTDMRKKTSEMRQDTSLSTEDKRAKRKEINDAFVAKMKEILTPDQFTKFQKMVPGRRPAATPPPAAAN